jgi:hypothetical protein
MKNGTPALPKWAKRVLKDTGQTIDQLSRPRFLVCEFDDSLKVCKIFAGVDDKTIANKVKLIFNFGEVAPLEHVEMLMNLGWNIEWAADDND